MRSSSRMLLRLQLYDFKARFRTTSQVGLPSVLIGYVFISSYCLKAVIRKSRRLCIPQKRLSRFGCCDALGTSSSPGRARVAPGTSSVAWPVPAARWRHQSREWRHFMDYPSKRGCTGILECFISERMCMKIVIRGHS